MHTPQLYERLWQEVNDYRSREIINQFLYNVDLPEGWFNNQICLDVGCGSGFAIWVIQQLGGTCHACGLSYGALDSVRSRLDEPHLPLATASALSLPYACDYFDFVHCNGVLHHTTNPRNGFAELVRVTKPDGVLFVSLYGQGGIYHWVLRLLRLAAQRVPYQFTYRVLKLMLGKRKVPNSFMPANVSILDNLYVPIRKTFSQKEIQDWFVDAGFLEVVRTKTTIYDHEKMMNLLLYGEGYLQFRGKKPK